MESDAQVDAQGGSVLQIDGPEAFQGWVGESLGRSRWVTVDQASVNDFGRVTHDLNPLHLSHEAAQSFGLNGTIAHGLFSLALVGGLLIDVFHVRHDGLILNYGLNRVRFPAPMPVGARARLEVSVADVRTTPGWTDVVFHCTIEAEGLSRPVCFAEKILRYLPPPAATG